MNAEAALKRAKDAARSVSLLLARNECAESPRSSLESRLRRAVTHKEFVLHYQTKVDLATRRIAAGGADPVERSRVFGLVSPLDFVPCSRNRD